METNIQYPVFDYNFEVHIFEIPEDAKEWATIMPFIPELFWGGYFNGTTLFVDKFLRHDLSINLEKYELAIICAVNYLDIATNFDDPITLYLGGLQQYYELRGITDKPKNKTEEFYVLRGIADAVANNEAIKPVKVEYVSDTTQLNPRGE
jgi:hypothetical protein